MANESSRRIQVDILSNQQTAELSNKMDQKMNLDPLLKLPKYTLQQYECQYEAQQHRVICQPIIRSFVKISLSDAVRLGIPTQPGRKEMMVELPWSKGE